VVAYTFLADDIATAHVLGSPQWIYWKVAPNLEFILQDIVSGCIPGTCHENCFYPDRTVLDALCRNMFFKTLSKDDE